jgi:ComF family protein
MKEKFRNLLLNLLFPKQCFGCQKEGNYLCRDCKSVIGPSGFHKKYKTEFIEDLYFATNYKNPLVKRLITHFKYEPFVKKLSVPLSSLIIEHFQLIENNQILFGNKKDSVLIPIPLEKKKLRWRGFNQAEEIAKEISSFLKVPLFNDILIKKRKTPPQVKLAEKERRENLKGVFYCQNKNKISNKNILLVDDVYTTGSTMKECARVLKKAGSKKVLGVVIARAEPKEDAI